MVPARPAWPKLGVAPSYLLSARVRGPVRACILVRVEPETERQVRDALADLSAVQDAFAVLGQPEVVARVRVPSMESLGGIVSRVSEIDGVVVSETLLEIPQEAIS